MTYLFGFTRESRNALRENLSEESIVPVRDWSHIRHFGKILFQELTTGKLQKIGTIEDKKITYLIFIPDELF